jgi:phage-related protein (TIGR01555 family)
MTSRNRTQPKARTSAQPASPKDVKRMKISSHLLALAMQKPAAEKFELKRYEPAPGVVPPASLDAALAMDDTPYNYINNMMGISGYTGFPGYPYLAELAQLPEYRKMVSTLADEMTRKWISLRSTGGGENAERIQQLDEALRGMRVREHFRKAAEQDGYFGRAQLYIDVTMPGSEALASDDDKELQTPLFVASKKVPKGSLLGFRTVEAMWTYPQLYNSTNPLKKNFYKPTSWFVMGQTVHDSRLLLFVSRPVPDILKAAYSFGGLSLSQLAKPYIDHWIRTRDSVSDIVHSFSVSGIKTNMEATLSEGSADGDAMLLKRAQLFNMLRDNRGLMLMDKDTEEFFQFNTPLSGLDALQAQAQEQMAAVSSIPLVKLLGITPSGLNASSDGEIRVFYDYVHSAQENLFREPLKRVLDLVQLSTFGDIDPTIDFVFEPLYQLSEGELATARKTEAETDAVLINASVISADEARQRIVSDPDSPYNSLDLNDGPDQDEEEEGDGAEGADTQGVSEEK